MAKAICIHSIGNINGFGGKLEGIKQILKKILAKHGKTTELWWILLAIYFLKFLFIVSIIFEKIIQEKIWLSARVQQLGTALHGKVNWSYECLIKRKFSMHQSFKNTSFKVFINTFGGRSKKPNALMMRRNCTSR